MRRDHKTYLRWLAIGGLTLFAQASIALIAISVVTRPGGSGILQTTPVARASTVPAPAAAATASPSAPTAKGPAALGPTARSWAAAAYFPPAQSIVLFGGMTTYNPGHSGASNEIWTWDGRSWRQLHPVNSPSARYGAGMVYDPVNKVLVLFGGTPDGLNAYGDTWTWDGTNWKQMSPATSPQAWPFATMTYDSVRKKALLYLGGLFCPCVSPNQTWGWDGNSWSQVATSTTPDPKTGQQMSGIGGRLAFDAKSGRTLYVGSSGTWALGVAGWVSLGNSGTQIQTDQSGWVNFAVANDDAQGGLVELGANSDTWFWNGSGWTAQNPAMAPPARYGEALAYDPVNRQLILFGGQVLSPPSWSGMNDTWAWDGQVWKQVA